MDIGEESWKYKKNTLVIFQPKPESPLFEYSGEEGTIHFQRPGGIQWKINLKKTTLARKGSPMEKEIPISIVATEDQFQVIKE